MGIFSVVALASLVFAVVFLYLTIKSVPQGEEWTVVRFGKYVRTMRPGLHILVPVVESVGARINMMETVLDVTSQEVITRDNAMVRADAVAFYQVVDAAAAAYEVRNLERAMANLTQTNIRTVIGAMDLDAVLSNRDEINAKLLGVIDEATNSWGVKITRVEIKDLSPPEDIIAAMAKQMKAEREKRAEVLQAEGARNAAILRAEGEKRSQILQAEGRRESAFLDAEAREREAEAEARATRDVSLAIGEGNMQAINYFVAQRYTQALERVASAGNSKVVMIPLEAASVIGSVAGIAEIARAALGGDPENAPRRGDKA